MRFDRHFLLTEPGSEEPLPFQEARYCVTGDDFYESEVLSSVFFTLEPARKRMAPSIILTLNLPFEEVDGAFVRYYDALCEALGFPLAVKRLRLVKPNKKGDGEYARRLGFVRDDWP